LVISAEASLHEPDFRPGLVIRASLIVETRRSVRMRHWGLKNLYKSKRMLHVPDR